MSFRLRRVCQFVVTAGSAVWSLSVNRTIDDEKGDSVTGLVPSYSPVGSWSQGATCEGCFIHLDPSQTFDGTWHDTTHTPGDPEPRIITAHFTGTAVYVYNAIANTVPFTTTFTSLTFTLDGTNVGQFVHVPTDSTNFQYDVPVFARDGLPNTDHTIIIEATGDTNSSLVLFDYIVYTFEDDTDSTPSPPPPPTSPTTSSNAPPTTSSITTTQSQPPPSPPPNTLPSQSSSSSALQQTLPHGISPSSLASTSVNLIGSHSPSPSQSSPTYLGSSAETTQTVNATVPAASSQNQSTISAGVIAGGAVGGLIVIILVGLLAFCLLRRHRRTVSPVPTGPEGSPETRAVDLVGPRNGTSAFGATLQRSSTSVLDATPTSSSLPGDTPRPRPLPLPLWTSDSDYSSTRDGSELAPPRPVVFPSAVSESPYFSRAEGVATTPSNTGSVPTPSSSQPLLLAGGAFSADEKLPLDDRSIGPRDAERGPRNASTTGALTDPDSVSSIGTSTLRAQVAVLQNEVERLRELQEMQRLFEEAPPRYDEV